MSTEQDTIENETPTTSEYQNPSENRVWYDYGNEFRLKERAVILDRLENAVYTISQDIFGFYLEKENDKFTFDYKVYGLETDLIARVLRTYQKTNKGNLGVLLNGLKGTGKSVTAKIIANELKQPVILIAKELKEIKNCHLFINSIPQNITVFIDEYEKIFGQSSDMLTIMDGALNSEYRRVFLMTTNELTVDRNLIERPSRVRYLKKFKDLSPVIVEEIVSDLLEHKQFTKECIKFISNLETITVDIVKAVINEVNLHEEAPEVFGNVFNVKKLTGKFDIEVEGGEFIPFIKNASINNRPSYYENVIGSYFTVNNEYLGKIVEIIGRDIIEVEPLERDNDDEDEKSTDGKEKPDNRLIKHNIVIKVEEAEMAHYNYAYGYGTPKRQSKMTNTPNKKELEALANRLGSKKVAADTDWEND